MTAFPYTPADLLPHSGRMILIDRIIACDEHRVHTEVTITAQHLFADENAQVPSYVGLEIMAQSVGVIAGYVWRRQQQAPRVGFLLGTRLFTANVSHFFASQCLQVTAQEVYREENGMAAYDCQICCAGEVLAQARLSAYEPQNLDEFK